jgi:polyisoprenoid-binding protein YceI
MKNTTLVIAALALSCSAMANAAKTTPAITKATLDVAASSANWTGKKLAGTHTGKVSFKDGAFEYKNNKLVKGEVNVDLTSITNEDLKDAEYNKKLVDHLKSDAFFDVEKFPTATFKITSLSEIHNFVPGQPNLGVKGTLTIRGITKPLATKVFFTPNETGFDVKGKLIIERTQYGLKYNAKKFLSMEKLKEIGDKLIDDHFEVDLHLVAKK